MLPTQRGSIRLFRVAGIQVYVHWLWFVMAIFELSSPHNDYKSLLWNVFEYLSFFGIVLLHEFGHALACRSVGGKANRIVLWLLGGVAYVEPPPRPGAVLWSIVAGPLVNVLLVPITLGLWLVAAPAGLAESFAPGAPDLVIYLRTITIMNGIMLLFNLMPVYPLDGGQILQALLWFVIGRAQSLLVVSILGLIAGSGFLLLTLIGSLFEPTLLWMTLMAGFIATRSWMGFQQARVLLRLLTAPRHEDLACPSCGEAPPAGEFWICHHCRTRFDTFDEEAVCPECGEEFPNTACPECHQVHPLDEWFPVAVPADRDDEDVVV